MSRVLHETDYGCYPIIHIDCYNSCPLCFKRYQRLHTTVRHIQLNHHCKLTRIQGLTFSLRPLSETEILHIENQTARYYQQVNTRRRANRRVFLNSQQQLSDCTLTPATISSLPPRPNIQCSNQQIKNDSASTILTSLTDVVYAETMHSDNLDIKPASELLLEWEVEILDLLQHDQ